MRVIAYSSSPFGCGPRLFVKYEDVERLAPVLNPLSAYGGYDKDTGKAKGWEFPSTGIRFSVAVANVKAMGADVEEAGPDNINEFWE